MTRPLSNDLRERVIGVVAGGLSRRAAAERFGIGVATAVRWVRSWRGSGSTAPRRQGGDRRSHRIEAYGEELLALVAKTPDITLQELAEHLRKAHGLRVVEATVWRFLDRRGMTFKKTAYASERQRSDVLARRRAWFAAQPDLDPERLVKLSCSSRNSLRGCKSPPASRLDG